MGNREIPVTRVALIGDLALLWLDVKCVLAHHSRRPHCASYTSTTGVYRQALFARLVRGKVWGVGRMEGSGGKWEWEWG